MSKSSKDLVVVKFGSQTLTGDPASLSSLKENIHSFVKNISSTDYDVIVVSSGAVFCGKVLGSGVEDQNILATVGNPYIFSVWQKEFLDFGILSSQVLVTHREIDTPEERSRLKSFLVTSISEGVIPVINENDALSSEELKKLVYGGDNDGLAAEIAKLVGAKHLVLFTDTEGFKVEDEVQRDLSLAECRDLAGHARGSSRGGGMVTKLNAACSFVEGDRNRSAHIARAGASLSDVLSGSTGTKITA